MKTIKVKCPECKATGCNPYPQTCTECNGSGTKEIIIKSIKDSWSREEVIAYGKWRYHDKKRNGQQEEDAFNRWIKDNSK